MRSPFSLISRWSDRWPGLRELERLLRPGGRGAATFLGSPQQDDLLDDRQRGEFSANGGIQIYPEWTQGSAGEAPDGIRGGVSDCRPSGGHGRQDVLAFRRRRLAARYAMGGLDRATLQEDNP